MPFPTSDSDRVGPSPEAEVPIARRYAEAGLLVRQDRLDEAIVAFLEVLRTEPEHAGACGDLGVALARLERMAEAEVAFREAARLDPANATACINLATCLHRCGNSAEATLWALEALQLKPDLESARRLLEAVRAKDASGDSDQTPLDTPDSQRLTQLLAGDFRARRREDARPYDVAVVIPTILRPTLSRAVRSVFAQEFDGRIQILIGVDDPAGNPKIVPRLAAEAPEHCAVAVFDPGYSTSARRGGIHPARDGGALRTILSYAANSRLVAYLDDDNWWAPDHLATLVPAIEGRSWAFSLRRYADAETSDALGIDRWESVGPDRGCYRERFGGWVDPNCLLLDKLACEPALRLWSTPLLGDRARMSADRAVFSDLIGRGSPGETGRATSFYTLNPADGMHPQRLRWIDGAGATAIGTARATYSVDWFTHNLPILEEILLPLAGRPLDALEIGVFEGRSAVWLLERVLAHPDSSLTWVDTFGGSAEHAGQNLSGLEARFRANVARFGAKVSGHVGRSQDVLRKLSGERFGLVYLDGSHEAADVLADAVLAWPLLKPGGLLGFDDYRWRDFPEPERCPGVAVDGFLAAMKGRYREVHRGYQLWVEKIR